MRRNLVGPCPDLTHNCSCKTRDAINYYIGFGNTQGSFSTHKVMIMSLSRKRRFGVATFGVIMPKSPLGNVNATAMFFITFAGENALQWRHNTRDGLSNQQPRDCLLNRLFRRRSKKTSKLRVTGICAGNSPVTGEFPTQRASNAENVSICYDVIMDLIINQSLQVFISPTQYHPRATCVIN